SPTVKTSPTLKASPTLTAGSVRGTVYGDLNKNKRRDSNERLIPSARVSVTKGNKLLRIVTVDKNGTFSLENLTPDSYTFRIFPPLGYTVTTQNPVTIKLDSTKVNTVSFGLVKR